MSKEEEKRYGKLGYKEALARHLHYPLACEELSFILRQAYTKLPKNLQSIIFQDTLLAFRLLPQMQTCSALSAVHHLLLSAVATLPKQKKNLAITEFKHAKISHKRHCKPHAEDECTWRLPQDVLIHIFSFLDMRSLVSVGLVCWSWNFAAGDNHLWQAQWRLFFAGNHNSLETNDQPNGKMSDDEEFALVGSMKTNTVIDWRDTFRREYIGKSSKRLTSNRGHCNQCKAIVWLDNMKCCNRDCGLQYQNWKILISSHQIVDYLLNGSSIDEKGAWAERLLDSSSDSDSEADESLVPRLWAYPLRW